MTYLLSFLTLGALVYYLTGNLLSSVIAGLAYSFSVYHLAHQMQPTLSSIQWLPLFILILYMWNDRRTILMTIASALMFACVAYGDAYYAYFASIIALIFVIHKRVEFKLTLIFGILSFLLILPFALWSRDLWVQRLDLYFSYKATVWDYFNPVFYLGEKALFIPSTIWVLALVGIRKSDKFFVILGSIAFILSLNNPLFCVYRASARWGLIVLLSVSVLCGFGINFLSLSRRN